MKSNITLRAPILALASFVLIQNVGVVKAQSITAVAVTLPTTDNILTAFTHSALAATDSVARSYFNAGCIAPLTLAGTGFETLALATTGETSSTVTNTISQIYDEVPPVTFTPVQGAAGVPVGATRGERMTYCVRLTYTTPAGISDFLEVDITYNAYFNENVSLGGTVTGSSNNPNGGTVDSSLLTVSAFACDAAGTQLTTRTVLEGVAQRFCVYANQHPTTGMVGINTFSFSGTPSGGTPQTQTAIAASTATNGLTTVESCTAGAAFCAFSTTVKGEFYLQTTGQRVTVPTTISGSGTATIRIGGTTVRKARVLLMLGDGDQVVKETSEVEFLAAPKEEEKEECDCSDTFFLFWIFCWIFNCLFGL